MATAYICGSADAQAAGAVSVDRFAFNEPTAISWVYARLVVSGNAAPITA